MILQQENSTFLGKIAFMGLWQGKYAQADRIFSALAELNPAKTGPYIGLAQSHMHQGRFEEAEAALHKATTIDAEDEHVRVWQGMLLLLRGDTDAGTTCLKSLAQEAKSEDVRELSCKLLEA